tara:strand:+ start:54 stop:1019 length:966 start_codon:yes stop_codon:yes gene_type:complete
MKVFITGCSGFIGYHLSLSLLKKNIEVFGIDNMNNYYDPNLKEHRLRLLKKYSNFSFKKIDLVEKKNLSLSVTNFNPDYIIHLAAQAGVRHSLKDPVSYMKSNLEGFINTIETAKDLKSKNFIYASSSSVYGGTKEIPFAEDQNKEIPISLYGYTKLINEQIAENYSNNFLINSIGLRFFSVYGPFGRPDMAYYSFTKDIDEGNEISIYNDGQMSRDMTYVSDIVDGILKSIVRLGENKRAKHEIFNLGNEDPIKLGTLLSKIESSLRKKADINYRASSGEVENTYADLSKSKLALGYNPKISFEDGMNKFYEWYKKYYER